MMQVKNLLMDSAVFTFRSSLIVFLLSIVFSIQIVSSSQKFDLQIHKTKEAKETKSELYCFSCDYLMNNEDCVNINRTRQLNLTKKCENDENFCVVKRFVFTTSDKNSTSEKKLWSLQRECTKTCENGCIVIGERVKLYACSSCCQNNLCNVSSNGNPCQNPTSALVLALLTIFFRS